MSETGFFHYLTTAIGAVTIALLLFTSVVIGVIFWVYKKSFKSNLSGCQALAFLWLPSRLHLTSATDPTTETADRTSKRSNAFLQLGFEKIGRFRAVNDSRVTLVALQHRTSGCLAVVYYSEGTGTWSDVIFPSSNEWIAASNVKKRLNFLHLPGDRKFHEPNKLEAELVDLVCRTAGSAVAMQINTDNFAEQFENAFARTADTRLLEPVEDYQLRQFIRDSASPCSEEEAQTDLSDQELKAVRERYAKLVQQQIAAACALDYKRQGGVSASEWQRSSDRLLVIHDRTVLPDLIRAHTSESHVTKQLKPLLKKASAGGNARDIFNQINAQLPSRFRYFKLGSVTNPVAADIYRAPLEGMST